MDTLEAARTIGWLSLGSGAAMMVAPGTMAHAYGLPENHALVRLLGARDLIIGAGILRKEPARWMRYRTISDALDTGMIAYEVARRSERSFGQLAVGVVLVTALAHLTRALPGDSSTAM